MVNKHLADLLQEEAQKFTPPEGESVIEIAAQVVEENADKDSSAPTLDASATNCISSTNADLEETVKQLQKNLEKSQKQEISLQQQISNLKSALFEQELSLERLTKELDETKKTALQLAEANSQLIEEIKGLKRPEEAVKALVKEPIKESYNPLNYRKSHRSSERLQEKPTGGNDDFADNTWLYD